MLTYKSISLQLLKHLDPSRKYGKRIENDLELKVNIEFVEKVGNQVVFKITARKND